MKLKVVHRGKALQNVKFWKDKEELEVNFPVVLVGGNGAGKSVTLQSIAVGLNLFLQEEYDDYLNSSQAKELYGEISLDVRFDKIFRYSGTKAYGLPRTVETEYDILRMSFAKMSHGESALNILAKTVMLPVKEAVEAKKKVLVLLDEPETSLTSEAQQIVASKFAELSVLNGVVVIVATQSDRIRNTFVNILGTEVDFGGWLKGNPWKRKESTTQKAIKLVQQLK